MNLSLEQEMGLAARLQRDGNLPAAESLYRKILKSNPKLSTAHYNLALILKNVGKTAAADKSFKLAVKTNPAYTLAWQGYARFLSDRERHRDAVRSALQAAKLLDGSAEASQLVADMLQTAGEAPLGKIGEEALLLTLGRSDVDGDITIRAALQILRTDPVLKVFWADQTPSQSPSPPKLIEAITAPINAAIIANLILPTAEGESLIRTLRDLLLAAETAPNQANQLEAMAVVALQLELREYCLPRPESIAEFRADPLEDAVRSALIEMDAPALYEDLLEAEAERLEALPFTRLLLTRLGPARQKIATLKARFSAGDAAQDTVSKAVQDQYEESPYPRWQGVRHGDRKSLPALVQSLFPRVTVKRLAEEPKVLVAGSGTGRHALRTALRLENAEVTALDLSAASLAYAEMKREILDLQNIHFQRADITRLPEDLGKFDLIECCGVLHHMADPEGGWSALLTHLKPDGVMKVALYSEAARQDVVAARETLQLDPKNATLDEIREAREKLLDLPNDHPAKPVTKELDFYSLSGCRDFLFHRQEQRFTIGRIAKALEDLKLEFLGFEFVDPGLMETYQLAFPSDPFGRRLENWEKVEEMNPSLFRGMYQFWCSPL
ncbi:class I SAM-dependent methyltransferase [Sneathiella limimaris]|uniref:class I SAM-dependent methyltransferase n=1 Tax=Sneathiella limimaris TaxID=1964213 RepID=UPI00146A69B7|nr:methyltransferase domain-containing protein [Sneathiella limimaris]